MLSLTHLLALAGTLTAMSANACNSHIEEHPTLWLATLRNSTADRVTQDSARLIPGFRLIRFEEGASPIPVTPFEKSELERSGLRFTDVTENDLEQVAAQSARLDDSTRRAFPTNPTKQAIVRPILATLSKSNLQSDLAALTSYPTRYYQSPSGKKAATDLAAKLSPIAAGSGGRASVNTFRHTFGMSSVIARIEGSNPNGPVSIVGAHLDSINQGSSASTAAPGADDDGSGCVNLIESFRKLVASSFRPTNPIEFHWYSGEEGGLLGSAAIAKKYRDSGKKINAMMNLDMTAWRQIGTTAQIGFVSDRTDPGLTAFTKTLVTEYLNGVIPTDDECGYACSDHASWNTLGYPAVYPFESITELENPHIHTAEDTSDKADFSFDHMHEFTKLAVAFVVELSS